MFTDYIFLQDEEEEGEVKEPGDKRPSVRPTCRFFAKGQCTWGSNCRFIHPGFNDKGKEVVRDKVNWSAIIGIKFVHAYSDKNSYTNANLCSGLCGAVDKDA